MAKKHTDWSQVGITARERKHLAPEKKDIWEVVDKIALVLTICLLCYLGYLVLDLFVVPEKTEAHEVQLTDLEVHEDWERQTKEFCEKKLKV
jgi:hypothetical protein